MKIVDAKTKYVFKLTKLSCGAIKMTKKSKFACLDADGMDFTKMLNKLPERYTVTLIVE
jgi:hypothetical protein